MSVLSKIDKELARHNTQLFFVGGYVRDSILGIVSKDIDIIIPHIEINDLIYILKKFGKVDLVGKSFGVIKFKVKDVEFDVSVPRIEKSIGGKHTDFDVTVNKNITLEEDLKRRDFTINAIAMSLDGVTIDPFNGIKDIKSRRIHTITEKSFTDDPLRMLRGLQFASRFGFKLSRTVSKEIKLNRHLLSNISPERILIEFQKGVKGNAKLFASLLFKENILTEIFTDLDSRLKERVRLIEKNISLPEFLVLLNIPSDECRSKLKITSRDFKIMKRFENLRSNLNTGSDLRVNRSLFELLSDFPELIDSKLIPSDISKSFKAGKFPKNMKELKINGDDLLLIGFEGKEIGKMLDYVLSVIFAHLISNNKHDLIEHCTTVHKLYYDEDKQSETAQLVFSRLRD